MDETPKITLGKLEWGVIISLLISAGSTLFSAGVIYGEVKDHERRLIVVETKSDGVGERLAKIEGSLDFLVSQYKDDRKAGRRDGRN